MKVITFNCCMFCIFIYASAFFETDQDDVKSITSCVVKMLEEIDYKKYNNFMDVTVMNMNDNLKLSALYNVEGARFVSRKFFWDSQHISNTIYIVMSEDYEELKDGLSKVTTDVFWNPSAKFIIVLQSFGNYSLHDISELLHVYNMFYEVSVISPDGFDYAIYKYYLTTPGYCFKSSRLTFWSSCSDYRTEKKLPLLNKGSIRGCHYTFITHNLWPFVNFDTNQSGVEQYLMILFQQQYGVKIYFQQFNKLDRYGRIVRNATVGMLRSVVSDAVEGAIGGYEINVKYSGNSSYVYPMEIDHMFFILAHANYLNQWVAVLSQSLTSCIIIGLLFVTFCITATLLSIFRTRNDVSHNVLIVFGYLLNKYSVKNINCGWARTLVFSSLLFTAFILPYAIQANLFSVTTEPIRGYEPETSEDLKNYHAALYSDWQRRYEFSEHTDCGTRINCLLLVKNCENKSLYTVVSNAHYQVYQWQLTDDQCNMAMYRLKIPYSNIFRTIYLRRGSVLLRPLNNFILQVLTTGILQRHVRGIYFREWLKCKSYYKSEHVPLKLANFYYIFMILIGGYCSSFLIFIYEIKVGSQNTVCENITLAQ